MSEKPNQKDIFLSGINNFSGGDLVLSSPDLIAVKCGIKKAARMEVAAREIFDGIKEELARHGIAAALSDEKLLGKYNLYASKDKETAKKAKNSDPSFKIINRGKTFARAVGDVRLFSRLLSYPSCCVSAHISNTLKKNSIAQSVAFKTIPPKINFLFNNLLNGASNHYLSFHFPCSFVCRKTLVYQAKIFDKIKRHSPFFAEEIKSNLRRPFLIFLNPSAGNMYVSWDNRTGFIFEGRAIGNELFYSRFLVFRTGYPDYACDQKNGGDFNLISEWIKRGDRIVFGDSGLRIFKNRSFIRDFKNSDSFSAYFLNFV